MDASQYEHKQSKGTFDWNLFSHEFVCSPRMSRILGFQGQTKITYADFIKTFHPDDKAIWDYAIKNAFPREFLKFEMRIILEDKSIRWIKFNGKITYDHNKRIPLKIHATAQDITEFKSLLSELKDSEEKFKLLADSIPQQIWTSDTKGHINYFNQAVSNYSGLNPEEIQNKGWMNLLHANDREESIKKWTESIASGNEYLMQHRLINFIGEYRWHESRAIPQKDSQGKIQMWVGTVTDIHHQKTSNSELEYTIQQRTRKLREENVSLAQTNTKLEQFAYLASHDLQEPLRKIITFSNRIQQKYNQDMPEGGKAYLEKIISSSQRMTRLIEDLLNFSMVAGSEKEFAKTDLQEILKLVLIDFEELIRDKKASIITQPLPVISANTVQISQLIHNLIGNALKFTKEDADPIITITSQTPSKKFLNDFPDLLQDRQYIEIIVKDNGIGFDQEHSERIFTIFQRLDHGQKFRGTGIGLALCKKIVENHHGMIHVKSALGKGTAFHVIIPV